MAILWPLRARGLGLVGLVLALLPLALGNRAASAVAVGAGLGAATPAAEGYAHPQWLADAAWLRERLGEPGLRVVALTAAEEYAAGHVPGAVLIDWPELELTDTSECAVAAWRGEVEAKPTPLGTRPDETVVVYDGGPLYVPRLWWVLRQLGHRDVRVLDGGLPTWIAAGGRVETAGAWVGYSPDAPYRGAPNDALLATKDEVLAALDDPNAVLLDARSP